MDKKLNFKIIGQGKPIIILHGLFGMLDNWLTMAKKLEEVGYMSILIDQRDHGRSPHTETFNYNVLADDLCRFMEDNWIHKATLIGHSMGGKTALKFLADYEEMVEKAIIIDMGVKRYPDGHKDVFDALFSVPINTLQSRDEAYQILTKKLNHEGTVQFLMKNLTRMKSGGFEWKMNLTLLYDEYDHILEEIKFEKACEKEVCFIRGGESNYVLDEDIAKLHQIFPKSTFVTIPKAGHWVHVDEPEVLFQKILDFTND